MNPVGALRAELLKAATLPGTWVGLGVMSVGSAALTVLNAVGVRGAVTQGEPERVVSTGVADTAFAALPIGTVGAVVVGVLLMSSEYAPNAPDAGGGRQVGASLTAVPRRRQLLSAKAVAVTLFVLLGAALTLPLALASAWTVLAGVPIDPWPGWAEVLGVCAGATLYWVLTAWLALAVTALLRSGVIPLVVLILNSSVVSVSVLLTRVTPLAHWLPDLAGRRLFGQDPFLDGGLAAGPGAAVMAAWAACFLLLAGVALGRRDA